MKKLRTLLVLFVVIGGISLLYYRHAIAPVNAHDDTRVNVLIPQGSSLGNIAGILKKEDLIRSESVFRLYARLHDAESSLQAGSFILQPSMTVEEIIRALRTAKGEELSITIPEGYTVKDIDALLVEKGLIKEGEMMECARTCEFAEFSFLPDGNGLARRGGRLEGYLFPDTYFVSAAAFSSKAFASRLLDAFRKNVVDGEAAAIRSSGRSLREVITMASLIEEETRHQDEREIVSGILWKRLDERIGLGVDAAVRYFLGKKSAAITKADLEKDSPYNLRKVLGLPPGPIASPGLSSIQAALHPQQSPYYYYLHDRNGVIHYATTNDEHNANRAKYL